MRIPGRNRDRSRAKPKPIPRERALISAADWRGRRFRWSMSAVHATTLVFLLIVGLGPLLWMLKS